MYFLTHSEDGLIGGAIIGTLALKLAYKVIAVKSVHEILDFCENSDEASLE
jgi:hypothetical protein